MARNPLTAAECTQILDLRKTGNSLAKIAKEMHRAKNTITGFLKNPEGYLNGNRSFSREQRSTSREGAQEFIRVDYRKYEGHDGSGEPAATTDGAYNKVSFEHRAVIKFLSKLGKENENILADMKAVYEDDCPNIESVNYWVEEFKNGRILIPTFPAVEPKRGRGRPKSKHTTPVRKRMWVKVKTRSANSPKITKPSKGRYRHQETKKKQGKVLGKGNIKIKRLGSKKLLTIKLPALKKLMHLK